MKRDMNKIFAGAVAVMLLVFATGCNNDYQSRIDELNGLASSLEEQCARLNSNLQAISVLVRAVQESDMITGITEVKDEKGRTGYTINFVNQPSVTIYDGKNGDIPYVTVQGSSMGSQYWAIQYGEKGEVRPLLDEKGNKIPAVWSTPYFSIKKDTQGREIWIYTLDGKNWMELGPARGEDADNMFAEIENETDSLFVVFRMADGSVLKVPKWETYTSLQDSVSKCNESIRAQRSVLESMFDGAVYIVSIEDRISEGAKTGVKVSLSNGESFVISDWVKSNVPVVLAEKDTTDGVFYWTCRYADEHPVWITDTVGQKIKAMDSAMMPIISMAQKDGNYYWYVTTGGEGHFVLDTDGNEIAVSGGGAFAADSLQYRMFKSVSYDDEALEIVLANEDNTSIKLMRQYAVTLTTVSGGQPVGDVLKIEDAGMSEIGYSVTGAQVKDVVVMTEGQVSAAVDLERQVISVYRQSGSGSVSLIFTFAGENSTNTRFVKLKVEGPEE